MFNIGFGEMVMLAALALIFIGPKQLPEVARVVGRMLNELKRASDDLTGSFIKTRNSFDSQIRDVEKKLNEIATNVESPKTENTVNKEIIKEEPKKDPSQS
jgi:Tat protein translocase TatB subunit